MPNLTQLRELESSQTPAATREGSARPELGGGSRGQQSTGVTSPAEAESPVGTGG